jgi:antitoxin component YwqK of YwqJK toxin-antitoxin module
MKKIIAISLALVMALSLCACGGDNAPGGSKDDEKVSVSLFTQVIMTEKDSDGDTDTMKGVVEYDENYNIIGTKTYINDKLNYEVTYDKDITKPMLEKSYYEDGTRTSTEVYVYDENGNCLERTSTYDNGEETTVNKEIYTYDANGNILTEKRYEGGELYYEFRYTYTASGKLESETHNWNGEESWTRYTYDEHDNILTEKQGSGEEVDTSRTYENTYENGKLTEVKIYRGETLDERICYDADGNEILEIGYSDGEESYRSESTYENDKLVKNVVSYDGQQKSIALYIYDAKGNLTERSYTYGDDEPQRKVYTYNDSGDVIGLKAYEGDELEGEYTLTYETVTVSKEVAKNIEYLNALLVDF